MTRQAPRSSALRTARGNRQSIIDTAFLGLFAWALVGSTWAGCESSGNTVDPLEAEIAAAKRAKAKRSPAECTPGSKEPCYPGAEGTATRGVCKEGIRTCDAEGHWLECQDAVVPVKELCNGVDDDCNGQIDDGFKRAGTKCWSGQGECKSQGTYGCSADGTESTCSAPVIQPRAEVCDGKDNDCDGQIDEDDTAGSGAECRTGKVGVCSTGHTKCVGAKQQCVQDKQPSVEICNKLDDDCDGQIDDDCITAEEAKQLSGG